MTHVIKWKKDKRNWYLQLFILMVLLDFKLLLKMIIFGTIILSINGKKNWCSYMLNTSFNDSEPIVESPDDAIRCFLKTNIDHLYF